MAGSLTQLTRQGDVLLLEFNNPGMLNALDVGMAAEIVEILESVNADDTPVIVMTGTGRAYCAGGDIKLMARGDAGVDYMRRMNRLVKSMACCDSVIVSAVNGFAYGGGFDLVLASDMAFASSDAKLAMVHGDIGLVPDMGSHFFLPRVVGMNTAKMLLWTGEPIDADEAMRLGIVNKVIAPEHLVPETLEFAERLAHRPREVLRLSKRLLNGLPTMTLDDVLEAESEAQVKLFGADDHRARLKALLDNRKSN
ncbi:MAG: enoyl-CoA hydratase/isomerase family protein [Acidimicrobiaceae bacterium]|nr:enoyl-CoA hydratase/isomerase family protein [Acidimicrobiaceae bacterium]